MGDLARLEGGEGEEVRLFVLLSSQNISPSGGQRSNIVESSIKRIKKLWGSAFRDLSKLTGFLFKLFMQ